MEREVGGGIGMGNTCKPMAVSFQCMTKFTTKKQKKKNKSLDSLEVKVKVKSLSPVRLCDPMDCSLRLLHPRDF